MEIRRSMLGIRRYVIVALVCVLVVMSKGVPAHGMPEMNFIGGSDYRISSVTGVEVLGVTYVARFHHDISYLELEATVPNPLLFPSRPLAETASMGLVDAIDAANQSLGYPATDSTTAFWVPTVTTILV